MKGTTKGVHMFKLDTAALAQELHDTEEAERRALVAQLSPSMRDALRLAELPAARRHELLVREALADLRAERAERAAYEAETRRLAAAARAGADRAHAELHVDAPQVRESESAPPAAPEPHRAPKRWTADRLDELRAYRAEHGTKKAAEHFGVSESRVRVLLPSDNPPPRGFSVFAQRQK